MTTEKDINGTFCWSISLLDLYEPNLKARKEFFLQWLWPFKSGVPLLVIMCSKHSYWLRIYLCHMNDEILLRLQRKSKARCDGQCGREAIQLTMNNLSALHLNRSGKKEEQLWDGDKDRASILFTHHSYPLKLPVSCKSNTKWNLNKMQQNVVEIFALLTL